MYRSYCFTVRPLQGLSKETESLILRWLRKQHKAFATIEGEDEARHMHGQIWLEEPRERGKINQSLKRICEKSINGWSAVEAKVLSKGTRIAYSDWFDSYLDNDLKKSHNFKYIVINNPPDKTEEYYPSLTEQEKIQEEARAVDKQMHRWEQAWFDYRESKYFNNSKNIKSHYFNIDKFVRRRWFVTREELGPRCPKIQKNFIRFLYCYINKLAFEPDWNAIHLIEDQIEKEERVLVLDGDSSDSDDEEGP